MKRLRIFSFTAALLLSHGFARAEVTLYMNVWDSLPLVEIAQGNNDDCSFNQVIRRNPMSAGYRETFPGAGNGADDICWRRTSDPGRSADDDFTDWNRCAWDGECEIK